jgi:hypothetical protein
MKEVDVNTMRKKQIKIDGRFSTSLVWYHRNKERPHEGNRIIVYSPCYADTDPMQLRIIDSQFYSISTDAEWWAYVNCPDI